MNDHAQVPRLEEIPHSIKVAKSTLNTLVQIYLKIFKI